MKKTLVEELRESTDGVVAVLEKLTGIKLYKTTHEELYNALADRIEKEYLPRPRFEDGEPVKVGDKVQTGFGVMVVEKIEADVSRPEPTFDWEAFKHGGVAVQCKTEELARDFLKQAEEQGYTWPSGSKPTSYTSWDWNGKKTCYECCDFTDLSFGYKKYYKKSGHTIVKWGE